MQQAIFPEINLLSSSDLDQVVRVHMSAFPHRALTQLGREAVRRYYEWQLKGPHDAYAFGIFKGELLMGFCFAGWYQGALSGFLAKNRNYLVFLTLIHPWLVLNPLFRNRLRLGLSWLQRLQRENNGKGSDSDKKKNASFSILSIAVDPTYQGCGLGTQLMNMAEALAIDRGSTEIRLTVATDNTQAIQFYESIGWSRTDESKAWRGRMFKKLTTGDNGYKY